MCNLLQYSKLEDKFPYEYDINNNRTEKQTSYYNDYQSQQEDSVYSYQPDTNRLTSDGEYSYTYDKDGNLTGKQNQFIHYKYEWNLQNRLSKVYVKKLRQGWKAEWEDGLTEEQKQALYDEFLLIFEAAYDEQSRRYWKKARQVDGTWKETASIYTNVGLLYKETKHYESDKTTLKSHKKKSYIRAGGEKLAEIKDTIDAAATTTQSFTYNIADSNGTITSETGNYITAFDPGKIRFIVADQIGSTRVILDGNGDVKWFSDYEPFGQNANKKSWDNTDTTEDFTSTSNDIEIGLRYVHHRYMDSDLGRFISEDPIKAGLNWYIYAINNPLKWTDPTGLFPFNSLVPPNPNAVNDVSKGVTLQIGGSGTAGLGKGGTAGGGVVFGYSEEKGFQAGTYEVTGGGAYIGCSSSVVIDISISTNKDINDLSGSAVTIGGSTSIPGTPISGGGEVNIQLSGAEPVYTASIGGGVGPVSWEYHSFITYTWIQEFGKNIEKNNTNIEKTSKVNNDNPNKIHVVETGETLSEIANENGVSVDELLEANPQITDPNYIKPGDDINIPSNNQTDNKDDEIEQFQTGDDDDPDESDDSDSNQDDENDSNNKNENYQTGDDDLFD